MARLTEKQRIQRFPFAIAMITHSRAAMAGLPELVAQVRVTPLNWATREEAEAHLDMIDQNRNARIWSVYAGGYAIVDRRTDAVVRSISLR
jgi:putative intracellular protease/amidase